MKNKQIAAVLFATGLAVAGMTVPASATQADRSAAIETTLTEQNANSTETVVSDTSAPAVQATDISSGNPGTSGEGSSDQDENPPAEEKNGFVYDEASKTWGLYKDNALQADFTGFTKGTINNISAWYYVENGSVDLERTDFIKTKLDNDTEEHWYYVASGSADLTYTGLAQDQNGVIDSSKSLWYIKNGKISYETAVIDYDDTSWIITNGKVNTSANNFYKFNNTWYFVKEGEIQTDYTDVVKVGNEWWYIKNGVVPASGTTVAQNENGWWYIKNGKVDFNYNGFAQNEDGWWYIRDGKVDSDRNDVIKGTVNGQYAWWHVRNGKVTFDNTVAKNQNGWWRIENG